ncbi:L-lactate dehydrogenase [Spirulina sp. CS-785/01]|uniref:L-lactate dehydrogenase n=1 Tax=Spirulina sp. CS-785/01 TaxID=3021716 RepID=UPI003FA7005E
MNARIPRKCVLVGAGQVGMACAYSLVIQNLVDDLLLVDLNRERVEGEVMDLLHGIPFVAPTNIHAGTMADGAGADLVIITAGANQKPGESRLDLVQRNTEIFKNLIPDVVKYCPGAVILIVTNPVDIMTYVSLKVSGLPPSMVFGSGTVLDTARFRYLLAQKFHLDPRSIHGHIIGEHGDSEVPVWSKVNVAGMPLFQDGELSGGEPEEFRHIFDQVKNAAYEIIKRKGATSYAIGLAVSHIVEAILRDQNRIMTVSTLIENFGGIENVCLSLPSVVSRCGVNRVLNLDLSHRETQQLKQSATILQETIGKINFG